MRQQRPEWLGQLVGSGSGDRPSRFASRRSQRRVSRLLASLALLCLPGVVSADDWPQWRGPQRDGVWRETGIVDALPESLRLRWRVAVGGGFAGPAVADGRVFVMDRQLPPGAENPESRWNRTDPVDGSERILCLDAASGRRLWSHSYPCRYAISYPEGPRATPTVDGSRVYTLGAMGDLLCLDVATGRVCWSRNYGRDFGTRMNLWGMASAPLVDREHLIVLAGGSDGRGVLALDKHSGEEVWRALQTEDPGYSAPILVDWGGTRQLIVWTPVGLYGLDPDTGRIYWSQPCNIKMGHSIATPVFDRETGRLFVSSFFHGSMMLQLDAAVPAARLLWRGHSDSELPQSTEGLHTLMSTAILDGDTIYGVCSYGHLRALDASTGDRLWSTLEATGESRWSTAFLIPQGDRCFLLNEHGELILARLSRDGYLEAGRVSLLEPTVKAGRRMVVWSHPAFANRCVFARNDREVVCVDLAAGQDPVQGKPAPTP